MTPLGSGKVVAASAPPCCCAIMVSHGHVIFMGISLPLFPPPSGSCARSAGSKGQWGSSYWLLWNWGRNLKYLNGSGQWRKDKGATAEIELAGDVYGWSLFLPGGKEALGTGQNGKFFSRSMVPIGPTPPSEVAGCSTGQPRKRKDSAEAYEGRENGASLYYMWKRMTQSVTSCLVLHYFSTQAGK